MKSDNVPSKNVAPKKVRPGVAWSRALLAKGMMWFAVVVSAGGIVGTLTTVKPSLSYYMGATSYREIREARELLASRNAELALRITLSSQRTEELEERWRSMITLPEGSKIALQLAGLRREIGGVKTSLDDLNSIILDNPEKAVSLPLMRKDMENLESNHKNDLEAMRSELSRALGLGQWLIGLMFFMAIGLLGIAVGNLLRPKEIAAGVPAEGTELKV